MVCYMLAVLYLATGCGPASSPKTDQPVAPRPVITRITYSVRVSDETGGASLSPLEQRLKGMNNPFERTVWFDGRRSATQEETTVLGSPGIATVLRDSASPVEMVTLQLSCGTFWYPFDTIEPPVQPEASVVKLLDEEKILLGHSCKKALVERGGFRYTIWYAPNLHIDDPTHAVLEERDVPGLVLSMRKSLVSQPDGWFTEYTVTQLETNSKVEASILEMPKGAVPVGNAEAAAAANRQLFEKAMEKESVYPEERKQQFIGTWSVANGNDRVEFVIERFGADVYTVTERTVFRGRRTTKKLGTAQFHGSRLLTDERFGFRSLFLDPAGKLHWEQNDFFVFNKRQPA